MRSFSPQVISLAILGFSTSVLSYSNAWLIHADGKYLALNGTMSITNASLPSIAQCEIIAYDNHAWALQCGPEPVSGQPYDPPFVGIAPADNKTKIIATVPDGDPSISKARLGNWSFSDLPPGGDVAGKRQDDPLPYFALHWSVPDRYDAAFQIDGDGLLWAVFDGTEIPGAKNVNLTVYRNDG